MLFESSEKWVCTCPDPSARPDFCSEDPPDCASCVYWMDPDDLLEVVE